MLADISAIEGSDLPVSGLGLLLLGTSHTLVHGNTVTGNVVKRNAPANVYYDGSGRDNRVR